MDSPLLSPLADDGRTRAACRELTKVESALLHTEKMAAIGQLAAGVAHEINNPIGYIFSNFAMLDQYLAKLFEMLSAYEQAETALALTEHARTLRELRERLEIDYLKADIPALMAESREGIVRVRQIVQDLKDFSRASNSHEWLWADVRRGLDSTLNIVHNEIKYRAEVIRCYGEVPEIECLPSELNQVFLNLLVNAADAIATPTGRIEVRSEPQRGTCFRVTLPISQPPRAKRAVADQSA
jgi:signal transduction histidine kinase